MCAVAALLLWGAVAAAQQPAHPPTFGIIGGGIGGAASAYFLRQALRQRGISDARIIVLERDRIGGRMRRDDFMGRPGPELGAAVWHSAHKLVGQLADLVGVERTAPYDTGRFAVWNGREVVFEDPAGASRTSTVFRMLWRYGLSPVYAQRAVGDAADRLSWAHGLVSDPAKHPPWDNPEDFLRSVGLLDLAQQGLRPYLRDRGFGAAFVDEIVEGVMRNNYGQSVGQLNALAGLMALHGGAGELRGAKGGNTAIAEGLFRLAGADVRNSTRVLTVRRRQNGPLQVLYAGHGDDGTVACDAVLVAAPLDLAGIALDVPGLRWQLQPDPRHYSMIFVSVAAADGLSAHYFRRLAQDEDPAVVLTMEEAVAEFISIGRTALPPVGGQNVYKVLSREALSDEQLAGLFRNRSADVVQHSWHAFPSLQPGRPLPLTKLAPRIYYTGGLEGVLPMLETAAMGARNAVNMLAADWDAGMAEEIGKDPAGATFEASEDARSGTAGSQAQQPPPGASSGPTAPKWSLWALLAKYVGLQDEERSAGDGPSGQRQTTPGGAAQEQQPPPTDGAPRDSGAGGQSGPSAEQAQEQQQGQGQGRPGEEDEGGWSWLGSLLSEEEEEGAPAGGAGADAAAASEGAAEQGAAGPGPQPPDPDPDPGGDGGAGTWKWFTGSGAPEGDASS